MTRRRLIPRLGVTPGQAATAAVVALLAGTALALTVAVVQEAWRRDGAPFVLALAVVLVADVAIRVALHRRRTQCRHTTHRPTDEPANVKEATDA